ncbi:MAG: DUF3667 domain-containing protein [Muribaculaceae bacterium]|nr:DUF3667 domain-containing protein [Muribaculaceae bacterium]
MENIESTMKCRNCGCSCASNFCPECGQSVKEKRLENKSFFISLLSGLSRINQGFLYTSWCLLINPWKVIRDYINCRRVRYIPPVSMLIVVCFLSAFVAGLMPVSEQTEIVDTGTGQLPLISQAVLMVTDYLMNNMLIRNLTIYIPALVAIPMVFWSVGARKYNLAEYFAAMIYMTSSLLIFGIIVKPLSILSESFSSALEILYSIIICSMSMYKAFPIPSLKKRIGYFLLYLILSVVIYLLIFLAIATLLQFSNTYN